MQNNLCIDCNTSEYYYPKFNHSDDNEYINCYNDISIEDGYYLDDNKYMPCYPSCKKCSKFGNVTNQECTLCYSNSTLNETNCYEKCDYYYYFNSLQEYKCTINNNCPEDYKLIRNKNQCIYKCDNDDKYIYEYNNECYEKCPFNTKLIFNKNVCLDNCIDNDYYNYEYNNTCYHECPIDTKFILNKNICIDNCINDTQYKYEYKNICYEYCPNNSKLIENTNICIDNCINTENKNFEYNNTCYEKCPKNTYYYYKIKICYDEIPLGFYCNDSKHNTLDKLPENSKEFEREDIDICSEDSPYLYNNNSCIKECNAMDFLNHICKISNSNLSIKQNLILDVIDNIKNGTLDDLLSNVINGDKKDIIIKEKNILYQITSSDNQNNNEYENISTI